MKRLLPTWRWAKPTLFVFLGWCLIHGTAVAQEAGQPPAGGNGMYAACYALVILAVALGLMSVCRPSRRRDRARPEQYGESKITG
jgi:hypothetical protein